MNNFYLIIVQRISNEMTFRVLPLGRFTEYFESAIFPRFI